ncbi:MAG: hypothetical protein A3C15_00600 [Candidatus Magasanikbacteria bacterium RIFCSPHIGHO2_02_FULL_50_9b]|uniref:Uncharacterized protein n=1 Tax=Candidatus Magasanikbacteria bacterium RIFCSPHIGHO2_02_FULL_50_9b TaxID=1798682 RepID=A0A1F6M8T9_9BACT|nr:MAG: hypothetical protein A3C15_00600 [Candidatus Magasanikbacteria bacterium RIFCSPHIGHO2_02_FULL_50_9b]
MKEVRMIKDFKKLLKDFEPMVKDPDFLRTGRSITNFSLRPREAWANWLLCAVFRKLNGDEVTFSDDDKCDGIIIDRKTGQCVETEHVVAMNFPDRKKQLPKGEARIIEAINQKIQRGVDYAEGKFLVVFFDGTDLWYRNKVREAINGRHNFRAIYLVGHATSGQDGYVYTVTELHETFSVSYKVEISDDFTDFRVSEIRDNPMAKYKFIKYLINTMRWIAAKLICFGRRNRGS